MNDQNFLEQLIKMLVSNPNQVNIDRLVNEKGVLLEINVDSEDLGTLIGKQGRNIEAIRYLVRVFGLKNKAYVSVRLNQPDRKQS